MDTLMGKPLILDEEESEEAKLCATLMNLSVSSHSTQKFRLVNQDDKTKELQIPPKVFHLLAQILEQLGEGNSVICTPIDAVLTTQRAADLLGVSRTHLIKLLKNKTLPHTMVGSHRRVKLTDLLSYKERRKQEQREAMKALMNESEELGLYK
ncbi:MAG: helix-turn-helix domain-containing protein [Vulcanimicrobiota bacterium]